MKLSEVQGTRMKLSSVMRKKEPEYRVTDDMSGGERFLAGIGGGMVETGRKAANLLLPDSLTPKWASDEAIKEQASIDEDLSSTGAGLTGKLVGQTAATAPVGIGAGSVLARTLAARRGLQGAELAKATAKYTPSRAALEGAVESTILSNPGERLEGAAIGGAIGGAMGGVAKGVGALGRKMKAPKTESAQELEKWMKRYAEEPGDEFTPISQAVEEGSLWRQFYEGVVGNIPGGGQRLRGQLARSLHTFNETGLGEVLPAGANIEHVLRHGIGDEFKAFAAAAQAWDDAFASARNLKTVDLGKNWRIPDVLKDRIEQISEGTVSFKGRKLSGQAALDLKQALNELASEKPRGVLGRTAKAKIYKLRDQVEESILKSLNRKKNLVGQDPAMVLNRKYNLEMYPNWKVMRAAAEASTASRITPSILLSKATKMAPKAGKRGPNGEWIPAGIEGGGGPLQSLGKLGHDVLKPFPSRQGIFQTVAALGLTGGAGAAISDDPLTGFAAGVGAPIAASRLLARPGVQKMIMGEFSPRASKYAAALRRAGRLGRHASIPAYHESQDEY